MEREFKRIMEKIGREEFDEHEIIGFLEMFYESGEGNMEMLNKLYDEIERKISPREIYKLMSLFHKKISFK
jgi:hypothetical protein